MSDRTVCISVRAGRKARSVGSAVGEGGALNENLPGNVPCPLQISAFKRIVITDTGHFRTRSESSATHPRRAIRPLRVRSLRVPSSQTQQRNPTLSWLWGARGLQLHGQDLEDARLSDTPRSPRACL